MCRRCPSHHCEWSFPRGAEKWKCPCRRHGPAIVNVGHCHNCRYFCRSPRYHSSPIWCRWNHSEEKSRQSSSNVGKKAKQERVGWNGLADVHGYEVLRSMKLYVCLAMRHPTGGEKRYKLCKWVCWSTELSSRSLIFFISPYRSSPCLTWCLRTMSSEWWHGCVNGVW